QFLISYCYFAQNACAFLFTINRFTAICLPHQHARFWRTWKWPFIIVVHLISLAIPLATRWPAVVSYEYDPILNVYVQKRGSTLSVLTAMICYGSVVLSICILANAYSAYRLLKFKTNTKTSKNVSEPMS
ncbi:hypothetical protein PMAYCL1PPCAC_18764, partial [Pristionchus mayeri]